MTSCPIFDRLVVERPDVCSPLLLAYWRIDDQMVELSRRFDVELAWATDTW